MIINELKRSEILDRSNTSSSLARYKSRNKVSNVNINRVGLLEIKFLNNNNLDLYFDVSNDTVIISLVNFMKKLRQAYRKEYKTIRNDTATLYKAIRELVDRTLTESLNNGDILVSCTCPDFQYRYAYVATINGYKFGKKENRPAKKTNPNNEGSACKHVLKVLSRPSLWKAKIVTAITELIKKNPDLLDKK